MSPTAPFPYGVCPLTTNQFELSPITITGPSSDSELDETGSLKATLFGGVGIQWDDPFAIGEYGSLLFSAAQYADLGYETFGGALTVLTWAKPGDAVHSGQRIFDFGNDFAAFPSDNVRVGIVSGKLAVGVYAGAAGADVSTSFAVQSFVVNPHAPWLHIALTVSATGVVALYVNGASVYNASGVGAGPLNTVQRHLLLAKSLNASEPYYTGEIASLQLLAGTALDASDVASMYASAGCPNAAAAAGRRRALLQAPPPSGSCLAALGVVSVGGGGATAPVAPTGGNASAPSFTLFAGAYAAVVEVRPAPGGSPSPGAAGEDAGGGARD